MVVATSGRHGEDTKAQACPLVVCDGRCEDDSFLSVFLGGSFGEASPCRMLFLTLNRIALYQK
jgi:hypothetical protein